MGKNPTKKIRLAEKLYFDVHTEERNGKFDINYGLISTRAIYLNLDINPPIHLKIDNVFDEIGELVLKIRLILYETIFAVCQKIISLRPLVNGTN